MCKKWNFEPYITLYTKSTQSGLNKKSKTVQLLEENEKIIVTFG